MKRLLGAVLAAVAVLACGSPAGTRPSPEPTLPVLPTIPVLPSPSPTSAPTPTAIPSLPPAPTATPPAPTPAVISPHPPATTPYCINPALTWSLNLRFEQLMFLVGQYSNLAQLSAPASAGAGGLALMGQPAPGSGPYIRAGLATLAGESTSRYFATPWLATDEEGGSVQRLSYVIGALPAPRAMAAAWTPAQVRSVMTAHAIAMQGVGINMDLGPVLDTAPASDPLMDESERSFSENPQLAAAYGLAFAEGLTNGGVVPVDKHFPGLGHASADTDLAASTDPPLTQLESADLIPFESAIRDGQPVIMVSNAVVPGLTGGLPASLAPATYRFLRADLGFRGMAITDSLAAGAVVAAGYTQTAAAVAAVEAGADMVLVDATDWRATLASLQAAVASGHLPVAEVNAAVDRVVTAKGYRVCGA